MICDNLLLRRYSVVNLPMDKFECQIYIFSEATLDRRILIFKFYWKMNFSLLLMHVFWILPFPLTLPRYDNLYHTMSLQDGSSEPYTGDGSVDIKGRPVLKNATGKWKACPFILGNYCSLYWSHVTKYIILTFIFFFEVFNNCNI